jgi:hypothetical protein
MLALVLCLLASPPLSAAPVALVNGDFEPPGLTSAGLPVGWHCTDPLPSAQTNIQPEALRVRSGAGALRIWDPHPDVSYPLQSRLYPALPGETYRASAWVYNGSGDGWLYLEFYRDARTRLSERHAGCGRTGTWEQISLDGTCPPEARYVAVLLYSSVGNVGQSSWDDVALEGPRGDGEALNLDGKGEEPVDYGDLLNVGDRRQLLFDDAFFQSHSGFWWRAIPPTKTGERNVVADKPWEDFIINAWCTVMQDEGKFRMWYEAYDKSHPSDIQARYCYAESADGIHWQKPSLGICEFNGSTDNNILFNDLGGQGVHGGTVFRDPTAPPEERYKFCYLGPAGEGQYAVRGAVSPDGLHWTPCGPEPILQVSSDTQTVGFWDESLAQYVIYCRLWTRNRTVGRAASADFGHFPDAEEVLACDAHDMPDTDLYNSAALKYPYADHAYFIFTSAYHHTGDNLDVHLATSRDGIHWSRPSREPVIPNGVPGSMDDATIYCAVGLLPTGPGELSMVYHASRARHNQVEPDLIGAEGVYTRATLRPDRYVALDASQRPAEFVTRPLTFTGERLEVNADVRPQGWVRFELQDAEGKVLPGYALEDCTPLSGDRLNHTVMWKGGGDLSALAVKTVRLRCVAKDASLYAFQFARWLK